MRSSTVQLHYVWETKFTYLLKYKWYIISKRWACLHDKIHIRDWVNFEQKVMKNLEIGDLKSYTYDLIWRSTCSGLMIAMRVLFELIGCGRSGPSGAVVAVCALCHVRLATASGKNSGTAASSVIAVFMRISRTRWTTGFLWGMSCEASAVRHELWGISCEASAVRHQLWGMSCEA